jgi:UbiD family decarboxylase
MSIKNIQEFVSILKDKGLLVEIKEKVSPYLEIAEIHRRVIDKDGPALLFTNVENSSFPVVTNLFGTADRVNLAFGKKPKEIIQQAVEAMHDLMPPTLSKIWHHKNLMATATRLGTKKKSNGPILDHGVLEPNINQLPVITSWKTDGGPFVTLPLVYTEHPELGIHNLGMYRIHVHDAKTTGIHWQIHKGGGFHYAVSEKLNKPLPLNLYIGGPPALILAAIAPLPENVPELILASLLYGNKIETVKNPKGGFQLIAEAEFAFVGEVCPFERKPEGPFGDHYGYNSLQHDYPVFHIKQAFHRKNAIYPATVVGKPKQEDFYIGDYLQELLSPLFPIVMPAVKQLWSYGDTGFHCLAAASVKVRYPKEAFASGLRILGEGQLSLTKNLFLIDGTINLRNFKELMVYLLERCEFESDLFIFSNISQDTLDYTGPKVNEGSKMLLIGVGDVKRKLPHTFNETLPDGAISSEVFCPGILVVEGNPYQKNCPLPNKLAVHSTLKNWPMIFLVDKNCNIKQNESKFLWTTFTRFEPANDVYAANSTLIRHHNCLTPPIVIDCRKKPWYTEELFVDPDTANKVDKKWKNLGLNI